MCTCNSSQCAARCRFEGASCFREGIRVDCELRACRTAQHSDPKIKCWSVVQSLKPSDVLDTAIVTGTRWRTGIAKVCAWLEAGLGEYERPHIT